MLDHLGRAVPLVNAYANALRMHLLAFSSENVAPTQGNARVTSIRHFISARPPAFRPSCVRRAAGGTAIPKETIWIP
jgi:hypothetical protein